MTDDAPHEMRAFKTLNQVDTGVTGIRNAQPPTTRFSSSYLITNAQMSRIPISDNNFWLTNSEFWFKILHAVTW